MATVNEVLRTMPVNDLALYAEMAAQANLAGDTDACLKWYSKGLMKARELKNEEKIKEFSSLILTLL